MVPKEVAAFYGVDVEKVLRWVRRGELRAVNVGESKDAKKPRWVIFPDALEAFERWRASPGEPVKARRNAKRNRSTRAVETFY
jgi:excisionase family DNA binding protein